MEPTGFFYLYFYPIVSSIIAGMIFWVIFSFLPERDRKRSFGVGITNDLLNLNRNIFHYFDLLLRFQQYSPSSFQDKIHSSTLTRDDLGVALQNKVISPLYRRDAAIAGQLLAVGDDLVTMVKQMDEVINRLYSFNYFLSSQEVTLLRNIYEKIHRYMPYIESHMNRVDFFPTNPSLAFMAEVLLELQGNFRKLRNQIFQNKLMERSYVIEKIQWLFYSGRHKECATECKRWISAFPFDSALQVSYLIRCYLFLDCNNAAYTLLSKFLEETSDLIPHRNNLYPLLSDPTASQLIAKKAGNDRLIEVKRLVESETLNVKQCIASNAELRKYFDTSKVMAAETG